MPSSVSDSYLTGCRRVKFWSNWRCSNFVSIIRQNFNLHVINLLDLGMHLCKVLDSAVSWLCYDNGTCNHASDKSCCVKSIGRHFTRYRSSKTTRNLPPVSDLRRVDCWWTFWNCWMRKHSSESWRPDPTYQQIGLVLRWHSKVVDSSIGWAVGDASTA